MEAIPVGAEPMETTILLAMGGLLLTALAMFSGVMYRLGRLSARVDLLFDAVDQNREEIRLARQEFREELQRMREESQRLRQEFQEEAQRLRQEFREEAQELRAEMREGFRQLRDEIRRGNQQLLLALANHSHDPDTGVAMFRIPPVME